MKELADEMRACGVRYAQFGDDGIVALELHDTEPAPPPDVDDLELPDEPKPPGICVAQGCGEPSGWRMSPNHCRAHGLAEAGVAGAMRNRE